MPRGFVLCMECAGIAKTTQDLTAHITNKAWRLTVMRCKSCRISALSSQLNMGMKDGTAAQRSRLIHSRTRFLIVAVVCFNLHAFKVHQLVHIHSTLPNSEPQRVAIHSTQNMYANRERFCVVQ